MGTLQIGKSSLITGAQWLFSNKPSNDLNRGHGRSQCPTGQSQCDVRQDLFRHISSPPSRNRPNCKASFIRSRGKGRKRSYIFVVTSSTLRLTSTISPLSVSTAASSTPSRVTPRKRVCVFGVACGRWVKFKYLKEEVKVKRRIR